MRFYDFLQEAKRQIDPALKAQMDTLRKQIAHIKQYNPKDPQLKNLRKTLNDLRMKSKGIFD